MTPSVPFAALSEPIKLFDGLDHTYPPEIFFAHLNARVTFQLGPQPIDLQSYLTWHSRRMFLLYCPLTGTASNWYDRLPQVILPPNFQETVLFPKTRIPCSN